MKIRLKRLLLAMFAIAAVCLLNGAVPSRNVRLKWSFPVNTTNWLFKVRSSPTVTAPLPWPVTYTMEGTNSLTPGGTNFAITFSVIPGPEMFYYVTASNRFWELETDPSNTTRLEGFYPVGQTAIEKAW